MAQGAKFPTVGGFDAENVRDNFTTMIFVGINRKNDRIFLSLLGMSKQTKKKR